MIQRIDHVSIAVKDFDRAERFFKTILGAVPGARSEDPAMKYIWQLYSLGDMSRLELLTPTGAGSFLDGFLSGRDGGVHHVTLQTPDLKKSAALLEKEGIPFFGYREYGPIWKELFIHPRDAFGVLIQIAEFNADDWLPEKVKMQGPPFTVERAGGGCRLTIRHPGGGTASVELTADEKRELARLLAEN